MAVQSGTVTGFDDPRGIGEITDDGGEVFPFHCTAITDGSRRIDVGAVVTFVPRPGHRGRIEATTISPR